MRATESMPCFQCCACGTLLITRDLRSMLLHLLTMGLQELLQRESNVTHVKATVVVVGDTHGQFHDLLEIFKIAGRESSTAVLDKMWPPASCVRV